MKATVLFIISCLNLNPADVLSSYSS